MRSRAVGLAAALALAVGLAWAQGGIERGFLRKIDPVSGTVTIESNGGTRDYVLTDRTRLWGTKGPAGGRDVAGNGFTEGAAIQFRAILRDGRYELDGMRLFSAMPGAPPKFDSSRLQPLVTLGAGRYEGFEGGLYPGGKSARPAAHEAAGLALAKAVRPLDADGRPSEAGKVVLLSVGMSNTTQEFEVFRHVADADARKNPKLMIVDGAQGGQTAAIIQAPGARFWQVVDERLSAAGVTRAQIQAAWLKEADARPTDPFPKHAKTLQAELAAIVRLMRTRFPNLKLCYLSSRTYGGYARTQLNPEPFAYESGFAVKWLIEQQIQGEPDLAFAPAGKARAPWLSWGPYLWANGTRKNPGGLCYGEADFGPDGTHPTGSGRQKVAEELLRFFTTDPTARPWFVR